MVLKRFNTYNYKGLTVDLVGFTTDKFGPGKVWLTTPMGKIKIVSRALFLKTATPLKEKPKRKKAKKKKNTYIHKPSRAVNVFLHKKLYKECESVAEAVIVADIKISALYKALQKQTMTKKGFTFEYANAAGLTKRYVLYKDGVHVGSPTSKQKACDLLGISRPTLNVIIEEVVHNEYKVIVEEIKC